MRQLALLVLGFSLLSATTAEARLFWQTYGATIPSGEGCGSGCTWNWNQDYFVPRYSSTGRYALFSPCKKSRTTSPACKWCHPYYPGYCSPYGPWHYRRRNHVYCTYCGCTPIQVYHGPWRTGCGNQCCVPLRPQDCPAAACPRGGFDHFSPSATVGYLPNVESSQPAILGSLSVEGDGLLANIDLTPGDEPAEQQVFPGPQTVDPKVGLPALLMQQLEKSTQPLPPPPSEY